MNLPTRSALVLGAGDALVIVDVQKDFLPGGSLAVPKGVRVVPLLDRCAALFSAHGLPVFATRDWHPPWHASFSAQGGPWPAHCVAGSAGAAFADDLHLPPGVFIVSKATRPEQDAYSAFDGTDFGKRLAAARVRRLFIGGLATDYCVLHTVRDALAAGFEVVVLRDATAAVDARPGDGERALEAMRSLGARLADSADILRCDTAPAASALCPYGAAASTSSASARKAGEISTP